MSATETIRCMRFVFWKPNQKVVGTSRRGSFRNGVQLSRYGSFHSGATPGYPRLHLAQELISDGHQHLSAIAPKKASAMPDSRLL